MQPFDVYQWAKIIIVLERTYSRKHLLQYQERYSVPFDKSKHQRGIMVITPSNKSRAFRSKGAAERWRVTACLLFHN